jgi:hypothetical protein
MAEHCWVPTGLGSTFTRPGNRDRGSSPSRPAHRGIPTGNRIDAVSEGSPGAVSPAGFKLLGVGLAGCWCGGGERLPCAGHRPARSGPMAIASGLPDRSRTRYGLPSDEKTGGVLRIFSVAFGVAAVAVRSAVPAAEVCCHVGVLHQVAELPTRVLVVGGQEREHVGAVGAAHKPDEGGDSAGATT